MKSKLRSTLIVTTLVTGAIVAPVASAEAGTRVGAPSHSVDGTRVGSALDGTRVGSIVITL